MKPRDPRDGGPAFPGEYDNVLVDTSGERAPFTLSARQKGMSLRDWFAGQALAECVRLASTMQRWSHEGGSPLAPDGSYRLPWPPEAARAAYQVADAMLRARDE